VKFVTLNALKKVIMIDMNPLENIKYEQIRTNTNKKTPKKRQYIIRAIPVIVVKILSMLRLYGITKKNAKILSTLLIIIYQTTIHLQYTIIMI